MIMEKMWWTLMSMRMMMIRKTEFELPPKALPDRRGENVEFDVMYNAMLLFAFVRTVKN